MYLLWMFVYYLFLFPAIWQVTLNTAQYSGGQAKQAHVMSELSKPWE